jgi:MscS family membrane protein
MISGRIVQFHIVLLLAAYLPVQAQNLQPVGNEGSVTEGIDRSTPRATVVGFLTAAHKGDWKTASQYIYGANGEDPLELTKELSVVLDQGLPVNVSGLSDKPEGELNDKLPATKELAGVITTNGGPLNVILDRIHRGSQLVWIFSPDTLKEIPAVYDEFNSAWISTYVPHPLQRRGWLGVPFWQWLVLGLGVVAAMLGAFAIRKLALPVLRRVFRPIAEEQDDWLLERLTGPLRGVISLLVLEATISFLHLPLFARQAWYFVGGGLGIVLTGWLFVRVVHVGGRLLDRRIERRGGADATAVIRLAERTFTVLTFCFVVTLLLKGMGLIKDVSTLLAGVGVGGIAIAFAAQKTLENLFGGISIIFDKTIRVGDACKIGAQTGTVEDIGLRSTFLRTDDRTILTIPNGQLSTMNIENFSMREKIYFHHVIGIRRETTAQKMRGLMDALRKLLVGDARLETSSSRVTLIRFGPSSLDLEIAAYILTTDGLKSLEIQEDLLLRIMDTIEANGAAAAFPSQTLYLGRDKSPMQSQESPI